MGVIYRNGKYYGGKDAIDVQRNDMVIGNGIGGLKGTKIFALGGEGLTKSLLCSEDTRDVHVKLSFKVDGLASTDTFYNPVVKIYVLRRQTGGTTTQSVAEENFTLTGFNCSKIIDLTVDKNYDYSINVKHGGDKFYATNGGEGTLKCSLTINDNPYSLLPPTILKSEIKVIEGYQGEDETSLEYKTGSKETIHYISFSSVLSEKVLLSTSSNDNFRLISGNALLQIAGNSNGRLDEWYEKSQGGPTVQLKGPSLLSVYGGLTGPNMALNGYSKTTIQGDYVNEVGPIINISQQPNIDITGKSRVLIYGDNENNNPKVEIGKEAYINMWQSLANTKPRHPYLGNINGSETGPVLKVCDNAGVSMDSGSAIVMHDNSAIVGGGEGILTLSNQAKAYFENGTYIHSFGDYKGSYKGKIDITNVPNIDTEVFKNSPSYSTYPSLDIKIHGAPHIDISQNPQFKLSGKSTTNIEGISLFSLTNGTNNSDDFYSSSGIGPLLSGTNEQFILCTKGAKANEGINNDEKFNYVSERSMFRANGYSGFGTIESLKSVEDPGASMVLQGRTRIQLGGSDDRYNGTGYVVCNFGNYQGEALEFSVEGNSLFKHSENAQFRMSNNSFTQMTGESHSEMHDDSIFIMRGVPLDYYKKPTIKPWADGNFMGWTRPIEKRGNGPVTELYDKSQILIRGKWDTTEKTGTYTMTLYVPKTDLVINSIDDFNEEINEIFKKQQFSYKKYYVSGGTVTKTSYGSTQDKITITNFNYSDKPADWKEHPDKIDGSPLIEIIEDSEIRLSGNIKITGDTNGISFSNGEKTIDFSFEQLEQLKALLS